MCTRHLYTTKMLIKGDRRATVCARFPVPGIQPKYPIRGEMFIYNVAIPCMLKILSRAFIRQFRGMWIAMS
jgi:hypothetical protein